MGLRKTVRSLLSDGFLIGDGHPVTGLTDLFRIEYKKEYKSMRDAGIHINDNTVRKYLGL